MIGRNKYVIDIQDSYASGAFKRILSDFLQRNNCNLFNKKEILFVHIVPSTLGNLCVSIVLKHQILLIT